MKLTIDYGATGLEIAVPDSATVLQMAAGAGLDEVDAGIDAALARPIGTPSLRQLAQGRKNACIVIADITRPVPNATILPPMLQILEEEGVAREDITILVGTGLHRPNEGEELVQLVGAAIARDYRIVNHMAREQETLTYLGDTSCGAPIWIDTLYIEADLKIATSLIEPHLMAGYSGGRKAICPGLMGVETMRVLHGPELLGHPNACAGKIEGNPFHRQALEVAQRAGVDFTLNVAMNDRREITGIFAGDLEKAHAEGVRFVERQNGAFVEEPVDIAITSSAGLPLDLTFYQAVKGLTAVLPIVKEGGTILIAARCEEGLGSPEFTDMLLNI
ncbi:MAG: nickel-dependent lactate racemase, partial [Candidatus Latescibacteria bacterium]|nr:nickel-dependent lactate racemase [Candidatus Latescibacterota bacterium]